MAATSGTRSRFGAWIELTRPFSLVASLVPLAVGSAAAWAHGRGDGAALPLAAAGVLLLQSGTNALNEVFDVARGVDTPATPRASHVLLEGRLADRSARRFGLALLALGVLAGALLSWGFGLGPAPMLLAMGGAALGYAYTGPPLALKYRGLGMPAVGLAMGPVMVLGAEFAQSGRFSPAGFAASLPVGCLVAAILLGNDLRDAASDEAAGIRTEVALLGPRAAWRLYEGLLAAAYALTVLAVSADVLPPLALVTLGTAPVAVWAVRAEPARERRLDRLDQRSAAVELSFGALLAVGLSLSHL